MVLITYRMTLTPDFKNMISQNKTMNGYGKDRALALFQSELGIIFSKRSSSTSERDKEKY